MSAQDPEATRVSPVLVTLLIAATLAAGGYFAYRLLSPAARPMAMAPVARAAMQGADAAEARNSHDRDAVRSVARAAMSGATTSHAEHGFDRDAVGSAARAMLTGAVASHVRDRGPLVR